MTPPPVLKPSFLKVSVCVLLALSFILGVKLNVVQSQLQTMRTILNDVWDKANHRLMSTAWTGGALASMETETTIFNDVWDQPNHLLRTSSGGGAGGGDFSSNTTTSVDGEVVLFSGTGGKFGRRPGALTGYAFLTNGVLSINTDVASLINQNIFLGRQNSGGALSTAPNKVGTTVPATCTVGDTFFKSDASAGSNLYLCTAPNVMTQVVMGGGGGGSGDFTTNTATSVDGELLLFSGSTGKVGQRATGTGFVTVVNGVYGLATDVARLSSTNTFTGRQDASGAASTAPNKGGTTLPATCAVRDTFFKDDAPAGQNNYGCTAPNTWTAQTGGTSSITTGTVNYATRYSASNTNLGPSSALQMNTTGILAESHTVTTITTNTALDVHNMVKCNAGGGTVVATLPSAATAKASRYTVVKGDTTGICQLARSGTDTFNGLAGPIQLTRQYDAVQVDLVDTSSSGVWWLTTYKAQWGYVHLNAKSADLPTSNAAIIQMDEPRPKLVFDTSASWCASWTFPMNPDYGTSPQIVWTYSMQSRITGSATLTWSVWKTSSGQAEDAQTPGYDSVNTGTDATVPGTAGRPSTVTTSLPNMDGVAANDVTTIKACSVGGASGNLELMTAQLQYLK